MSSAPRGEIKKPDKATPSAPFRMKRAYDTESTHKQTHTYINSYIQCIYMSVLGSHIWHMLHSFTVCPYLSISVYRITRSPEI